MKPDHYLIIGIMLLLAGQLKAQRTEGFVQRSGEQFVISGKPYHYVGANYWYGGLIGRQPEGLRRLRRELDFLKERGVTNLRVMAGTEGSGAINGLQRVDQALQPNQSVFNEQLLTGLDILLNEMRERDMKAVIFLSNNWDWTGGFLQYLNWNGLIPDSVMRRKLSWDELRDYTSLFYGCEPCVKAYFRQVELVVNRKNSVTGIRYKEDAAIMAWELANEPRPMRPAINDRYRQWIAAAAAHIKSLDPHHLVTIGHEGDQATDGDIALYEEIHAIDNIDYLTIHIWPKNWSWLKPESMAADIPGVLANTLDYLRKHAAVANRLGKPLVLEEFGLPRDGHAFDPAATVHLRDTFYQLLFDEWKQQHVAGLNFWAFSGAGRPAPGRIYWQKGDDYLGDPPTEEQGLNSVFDSDTTTWQLIRSYTDHCNKTVNIETKSQRKSRLRLR